MDEMLAAGELERPAMPVDILAPPEIPVDPKLRFMRVRHVGRGSGQLWEQLSLPLFCRGTVLFTPCGGSPLLHRDHVFTIPDAGVFATPQAYSSRYAGWYRRHHLLAVRNPRLQLLTVSEFSKGELLKWTGIDASRVNVTLLGHEHVLRAASRSSVLARMKLTPQRYILAVGSLNPNKNLPRLLTAYGRFHDALSEQEQAEYRLVIVGGANQRIFAAEQARQEGVLYTGFLVDGELRALYESAACFVFPSTYEGFGLPPLEAMALGCPVACSNAASLPQVCGDAAVYFDPQSADELVQAISRLMTDAAIRQSFVERGLQRSRMLSWKDTARATWASILEKAQQS